MNTLDDLADVPKGTVSYRIRQIIDTAATGFSAGYIDTVSAAVTSSCLSGITGVTLAPNPSHGALSIKVNTPTAVPNLSIRIFNSSGQLVIELKRSKAEGIGVFDVPVFNLASGKYYVSVYDDKKLIQTKELIKL